jgi:hypothetical protein
VAGAPYRLPAILRKPVSSVVCLLPSSDFQKRQETFMKLVIIMPLEIAQNFEFCIMLPSVLLSRLKYELSGGDVIKFICKGS